MMRQLIQLTIQKQAEKKLTIHLLKPISRIGPPEPDGVTKANHAPVIKLNQTEFNVKPGDTVEFKAEVTDPDNDKVYVSYESYPLYNRYKGEALIRTWELSKPATKFTVPEDSKTGDYFIFILRAEDDNQTPMTSFETVVVNVID